MMATEAGNFGATGPRSTTDSPSDDGFYGEESSGLRTLANRAAGACGDALMAIQARPSLAVGLVAIIVGVAVGSWLAGRFPRHPAVAALPEPPAPAEIGRRARRGAGKLAERASDTSAMREQLGAGMALLPVLLRLLSNPIVQQYLRRTLSRQIGRKLGR